LRRNQNNNKVTDTIACFRTTGWCLLRYTVSLDCIMQYIYVYIIYTIYTKLTFAVRVFYVGFRAPNSTRKRTEACFCRTPTRQWNIVLLSLRNQSEILWRLNRGESQNNPICISRNAAQNNIIVWYYYIMLVVAWIPTSFIYGFSILANLKGLTIYIYIMCIYFIWCA